VFPRVTHVNANMQQMLMFIWPGDG